MKDVTDTAAPYVKKGLETASEVAAPVVKAAEPVVKVLFSHFSHQSPLLSSHGGLPSAVSLLN